MDPARLAQLVEMILGVATVMVFLWVAIPGVLPWRVVARCAAATWRSRPRQGYLAACLSILAFNYLYLMLHVDCALARWVEPWANFGFTPILHLHVEGDAVALKPGVERILEELERRGILNSIASRNDTEQARAQLMRLGVYDRFVVPRIAHGPKPESLYAIAGELNLSLDALAFIDDSRFERESVAHGAPGVTLIEAERYRDLLDMDGFRPASVSEDGRRRAAFVRTETRRRCPLGSRRSSWLNCWKYRSRRPSGISPRSTGLSSEHQKTAHS